jgi:RNA polymerase sigma factor (sigma-70 family)
MKGRMTTVRPTVDLLLEHGAWLGNLARRLAAGTDAEDLEQDTWRVAIESPPDGDRPARPWLAQVLRNTIRTGLRRGQRRRARERAVSEVDAAAPSAEETLMRAQLHQRIAELLAELDDPYRATLVARFYEGLDSAEIARRSGIPAGTVRWRLKEGIQRLRAGLDEAHGSRRAWCALVSLDRVPRRPAGFPARLLPWSLVRPGIALFLLTTVGGGLVLWRQAGPTSRSPLAGERPTSAGTNSNGPPEHEEDPMQSNTAKRAATLVGAALPALMAAAQAQAALSDEAVGWCVELREKIFACKDEFAEAYVARRSPPPERQMALVAKALEEITEEGSGPLGPRREKCRQWVSQRLDKEPVGDRDGKLAAAKKMVGFCAAKEDCKSRVECLLPFLAPATEPEAPPEKTWDRLGSGSLTGKVTDAETGAPIPGVEVRVLAMATQRKLTPRRTDAAGGFRVDGLPEGEPVKVVLLGDRKAYVIERRLIERPGPSLELGTLRLAPGNLDARSREGSWRGVTGIVAREDESATVAKVGPGSPAEKAGVKGGDRLLTVDGHDVRGLPFGGLEWYLRGRPGTSVAVKLQTGGAPPRTVTLARVPD